MNDVIPDYLAPERPQPFPNTAFYSAASWIRVLLPAIGGVTLDLWTKTYAKEHLYLKDDVTVWPRVLVFTYTENPGAVFGMGRGHVALFILFSIVALGALGLIFVRSRREQWVQQLAVGLIMAGAVGNLYDRVVYGQVRDFILMLQRIWPFIFNVADVLLCVGVPLLMICWVFQGEPAKPKAIRPS